MEKTLQYDRVITPQETYFWCGPASTQVVLNSRGIILSEEFLAGRLGTTSNGTDSINQFIPVLNQYLNTKYIVRSIPNDPPTLQQVNLLWDDVVKSVDAGFGIVGNIIAPPNNYPVGTNGSTSPAYGGGTVYHYVAIMGYFDNGHGRHVWVADSGFRPFGYFCSVEQMASLIAGKGYAANPYALPVEDDSAIWADLLIQSLGPK